MNAPNTNETAATDARDWMVYDAAKPDPWGISTGDFGPMTQAEAEAWVANGAAQAVPRHYFALPIKPAKRSGSDDV